MWVSKMQRGASGKNPVTYNPEQADWKFLPANEVTRLHWFQQVVAVPRKEEFPVSDAYLALMGAYVSEGTVAKRLTNGDPSVLSMCQADGGRLHDTIALAASEFTFRSYHYPARDEKRKPVTIWTLADRSIAVDITKACGVGEANKQLPSWSLELSGRQSNILLQALLSGDGTPYRTGGWVYYTTSERLAGDVQALAVLAGRRANVRGPYNYGGDSNSYQVLIHDPGDTPYASLAGRNVREIQVENRRIVCFTVPNETLITRRGGHVAMHGNTKFAAHAIRLGIQGTELLTTGRVQLPMAEPGRTWLKQLRTGMYTLEQAIYHIEGLQYLLKGLTVATSLPKKADYGRVNNLLINMYQSHWAGHASP